MGDPPAPLRDHDPATVGAYRLRGVLGVGGMGTVYLATAPDGRDVALKVINPALHGDPQFRQRFAAEAAAASRVAGFCTARVVDVALDGPVPHLVTEYVPGPSLHDYAAANGPLGAQVEAVAVGVAAALAAIHAVGLVHADLSPRNVLLSPFGPKVIDFGVARLHGAAPVQSGAYYGTPGWLAPEQLRGGAPSRASDVYVWGLLVAWAGTGRLPVAGRSGGAPDLSGLEPALADVVRRALRADPAARPSASGVLLALVGADDPAAVRVPAPVTRRTRPDPAAAFAPGAARVAPRTAVLPGPSVPGPRPRRSLPPVPPPPRRPPPRVGRAVLSTITLVALLACLLGALRLAGDPTSQDAGDGASPGRARSSPPPPPPPPPSPVAADGKLRFTVAGLSCGTAELGPWPVTKQAQGQFCLLELRVDNIGKGAGRVWLGSQHLRDTQQHEYSPDELSWIYYDKTRPLLNEINPGNSVTGTLVFDVPTGTRLTELRVKDSPLSRGSTIRLG